MPRMPRVARAGSPWYVEPNDGGAGSSAPIPEHETTIPGQDPGCDYDSRIRGVINRGGGDLRRISRSGCLHPLPLCPLRIFPASLLRRHLGSSDLHRDLLDPGAAGAPTRCTTNEPDSRTRLWTR